MLTRRDRITAAEWSSEGWWITIRGEVHHLTDCDIEQDEPDGPRCDRCGLGVGIEVDDHGDDGDGDDDDDHDDDDDAEANPARGLYANDWYCLCSDCLQRIVERLEEAERRRIKKWARGS